MRWEFLIALILFVGTFFIIQHQVLAPVVENTPPVVSSTSTTPLASTTHPTTHPKTSPSRFKNVMTTYFYVGEPSEASNAYIPNDMSYWDETWQAHFGGVDTPDCRNGYNPCGFTPKENPFYVALPFAEYDSAGNIKNSIGKIPWFEATSTFGLKNHWVEVKYGSTTCYGQWEDVGPNGEDDFAYVFGEKSLPVNTFGEKAGLDVSPALLKCLGLTDNAITSWRFVDAAAVPDGPWRAIVTSSPISW